MMLAAKKAVATANIEKRLKKPVRKVFIKKARKRVTAGEC